mgnify:CR=1 FL=1
MPILTLERNSSQIILEKISMEQHLGLQLEFMIVLLIKLKSNNHLEWEAEAAHLILII